MWKYFINPHYYICIIGILYNLHCLYQIGKHRYSNQGKYLKSFLNNRAGV